MNNNAVFAFLVSNLATGTLKGADATLDSMAPGDVGVFNAKSNLAVADIEGNHEIFLANVRGSVDNKIYDFSAGQSIQVASITDVSYTPYSEGKEMEILVKDLTFDCGAVGCGLRMNFYNQHLTQVLGKGYYSKSYIVSQKCCDLISPDGTDPNLMIKALLETIQADTYSLVTATAVDDTGAEVTDIDAFIATNETVNTDDNPDNNVTLDIKLVVNSLALSQACGIPLDNFTSEMTRAEVIGITDDGCHCSMEIEVTQELEAEIGGGNGALRQLEYYANGWGTSGPYRSSNVTNIPNAGTFKLDGSLKYDTFIITHQHHSKSAWLDYQSPISTYICVNTDNIGLTAALKTMFETYVDSTGKGEIEE